MENADSFGCELNGCHKYLNATNIAQDCQRQESADGAFFLSLGKKAAGPAKKRAPPWPTRIDRICGQTASGGLAAMPRASGGPAFTTIHEGRSGPTSGLLFPTLKPEIGPTAPQGPLAREVELGSHRRGEGAQARGDSVSGRRIRAIIPAPAEWGHPDGGHQVLPQRRTQNEMEGGRISGSTEWRERPRLISLSNRKADRDAVRPT